MKSCTTQACCQYGKRNGACYTGFSFGGNFSFNGEIIIVRKLDNNIVQALTGLTPDQAAAIMMDEYHGRGRVFADKILQDICSKRILAVVQFRHTNCCRSRTHVAWIGFGKKPLFGHLQKFFRSFKNYLHMIQTCVPNTCRCNKIHYCYEDVTIVFNTQHSSKLFVQLGLSRSLRIL